MAAHGSNRFSLLVVLGLLLALIGAAPVAAQVQDTWDHYKVYAADPTPDAGVLATLTDQFETITHQITRLQYFANPVQKDVIGGPPGHITNPKLHYTWWALAASSFSGFVAVENQFGSQDLTVGKSHYLLNPALKNEQGSLPVQNHYKCYDCAGDPVGVEVRLTDQWGVWDAKVVLPRLFCNPVKKTVSGVTYPIIEPGRHYVCYDLDPIDPRTFTGYFSDQFREVFTFTATNGRFLCVPTFKVDPTPVTTGTWGRLKTLYR